MMKSIRGTYENGTIKLLDLIDLEGETSVIITFLDDEFPFPDSQLDTDNESSVSESGQVIPEDENEEEYYERLRKHKRYKARGNITIVKEQEELVFPLLDYSAGGLGFMADRKYPLGENITAALKYNASGEVLVMDFEIIVRGVFEEEMDRYKIGCQFGDNVDEELWHTIMGQ
ncbi:PilZ domain-containing protein [bacterium]|nr:PilZ domain-containing protein [bacterium]